MNDTSLPLVSVLIPNYNHAVFLQKRIDSVLAQSYPNFELIILDDRSTDDSLQIIERYRHYPSVSHIILNDKNSGSPFIQWERGLLYCKGDIIWIAESDDYAETDFLEKLVPLFSDKTGLVYCDSNTVDAEDVIHRDFYKKYKNDNNNTTKWDHSYVQDGISELRDSLFYNCTINNMSATLFKKELLQYIDWPFLKSFKYCGDWFFLVTLAVHTQVAYHAAALNYFKYGTNNFKPGTRSVLNYFNERFKVRYFFWNRLENVFSKAEKDKLYREMGVEMRIQINEMIKRNSPARATLNSFIELSRINGKLFRHQLQCALKGYLRKK